VFNNDQLDQMQWLAEQAKLGKTCHCGWYIKGQDAYMKEYCQGWQNFKYEPYKTGVPDGPKMPCNVDEE